MSTKKAGKTSVAEASGALYTILEAFDADERLRIVRGTLLLLGDDDAAVAGTGASGTAATAQGFRRASGALDERSFFDNKDPKTKIEELATAARFRELHRGAASHTREDLEAVFRDARRNFDGRNFARDVDNARTSGYFNKGGSAKAGYTLSYYGQNFIDALPDRVAAKALRRPTKASRKAGKKKASKKAGPKK